MSDAEFASFLADFEGLDIALEDACDEYEDDLNGYEEA
jgi:hypothetical protein